MMLSAPPASMAKRTRSPAHDVGGSASPLMSLIILSMAAIPDYAVAGFGLIDCLGLDMLGVQAGTR